MREKRIRTFRSGPFDTIRVFGRFDFEDQPVVTVTARCGIPGDHVTNGATRLRDAVYLAGGTTRDAELADAQVFRHRENGQLEVIGVNLTRAMEGDERDNILLEPKDQLIIHKSPARSRSGRSQGRRRSRAARKVSAGRWDDGGRTGAPGRRVEARSLYRGRRLDALPDERGTNVTGRAHAGPDRARAGGRSGQPTSRWAMATFSPCGRLRDGTIWERRSR